MTPEILEAALNGTTGARNSRNQRAMAGKTEATTGYSAKVRFVKTEENSVDEQHDDEIEAQVIARNIS
jgi:hypothetical protein